MAELNERTPAGVLAFCDYLMNKGYATAAQINPWKTAIQKMFETVEGDSWESLDLDTIDFDEYGSRFQTLAGAAYKAESITAYKRRVHNAIQAHEHYRSTGRPPSFRKGGNRPKPEDKDASAKVVPMESKAGGSVPATTTPTGGMMTFPFPLGDGRIASLTVPPRMKADDVNRLAAFLRTLQDDSEQRQIPRRTGEDQQAA
jgi:hypothetical protein